MDSAEDKFLQDLETFVGGFSKKDKLLLKSLECANILFFHSCKDDTEFLNVLQETVQNLEEGSELHAETLREFKLQDIKSFLIPLLNKISLTGLFKKMKETSLETFLKNLNKNDLALADCSEKIEMIKAAIKEKLQEIHHEFTKEDVDYSHEVRVDEKASTAEKAVFYVQCPEQSCKNNYKLTADNYCAKLINFFPIRRHFDAKHSRKEASGSKKPRLETYEEETLDDADLIDNFGTDHDFIVEEKIINDEGFFNQMSGDDSNSYI